MFRKKQVPEKSPRNVRPQQTTNVFSYHANRSVDDGLRARRTEQPSTPKRLILTFDRRKWVSYVPSVLAGFVVLFCLVYVSTLSGQVKMQIVGDEGKTKAPVQPDNYVAEIQAVFNNSLYSKSKLLINTDEIAQTIQDKFPELGEVSIVLPLVGRRPIVQAKPKEPVLILGTHNGGFAVDESGRIMSKASDIDSSVRDNLPAIQDESNLSVELGEYALPKGAVAFVREVAAHVAAKGYKVRSMSLPPVANEMHLRLEGKTYYVKFDLAGESRVQAGAFIVMKEKLEKDGVNPREYLDVRVPGKVYYK